MNHTLHVDVNLFVVIHKTNFYDATNVASYGSFSFKQVIPDFEPMLGFRGEVRGNASLSEKQRIVLS